MNKYELALVVNAKIEEDARTAVVEKAKEYITRAGGAVTEVEEWGKKRLAYEVQKMNGDITVSSETGVGPAFRVVLPVRAEEESV